MSYILDALKKADAERERGQGRAPGLHAQPAPLVDDPTGPAPRTLGTAAWVIAALLAMLVGMLAWRLWAPAAVTAPVAVVATQPAPVAQPAAPVTPAVEPVPPAPSGAALPREPAREAAPRTARTPEPAPVASPPARVSPPPSAAVAATAPAARASSMPAARAPEATTLYTPQTLPEAVRRDLPAVSVSGAMYSETPAQRMLIIHSQVFREGDQPMPELVLEEIRLKSAVFRFRGHRVLIAY